MKIDSIGLGLTIFLGSFLLLTWGSTRLDAWQQFPLGILGGRGEVASGSPLIRIVDLAKNSPLGQAGLQQGDQIGGIEGVPFTAHSNRVDDGGTGPQRTLGEFLDDVAGRDQAEQRRAVLNVVRGKGEEAVELEIECRLPYRPAVLSRGGRAQLVNRAADQLRQTRLPAGYWDSPVGLTGDRVLTAWAVVALKAVDSPDDAELLRRAASWLLGPEGRAWVPEDTSKKGPDNLGNWALTATAVALVEACGGKPDAAQKTAIETICRSLRDRMDDGGRFGHDVVTGYSGKGFNVINTLAHLAWSMGHRAGIPIDEASWNQSLEQIRQSVDPNGGIRYWTMKNTGTADASLRTSSMALALAVSGRESELFEVFSKYLDQYRSRTREAHAVGSMGMFLAPAVLWRHDRTAYQRFLDEWRWYLALTQDHEGKIHYIGGKRNNGGDSYLGQNRIACIISIMMLAPADQKLLLFK